MHYKSFNIFRKAIVFILTTLLFTNCGSSSGSEDTQDTNDTPTAVNDVLTVEENSTPGTENQVNVSSNDNIGNDGGDLDNYSLTTSAIDGDVNEISDGLFEYIPSVDFFGNDSFSYSITDVDGDSDTATVNITVNKFGPSAEDFNNIDPNFPSFTSINNTTPNGKRWVKLESILGTIQNGLNLHGIMAFLFLCQIPTKTRELQTESFG